SVIKISFSALLALSHFATFFFSISSYVAQMLGPTQTQYENSPHPPHSAAKSISGFSAFPTHAHPPCSDCHLSQCGHFWSVTAFFGEEIRFSSARPAAQRPALIAPTRTTTVNS